MRPAALRHFACKENRVEKRQEPLSLPLQIPVLRPGAEPLAALRDSLQPPQKPFGSPGTGQAALGANWLASFLPAARKVTKSQSTPEALAVLLDALIKAGDWSIRRDSARLLSQIGQADKATLDAFWQGFLDEDNNVRTARAQALARLGRNLPTTQRQRLEGRLVRAIQSPKFDKPDNMRRPAYDYVYDALWLLVAGEEVEEA